MAHVHTGNVIHAEFGKQSHHTLRNVARAAAGAAAVGLVIAGPNLALHNRHNKISHEERLIEQGEIYNGHFTAPAGTRIFDHPSTKRFDGSSGEWTDAKPKTVLGGESLVLTKAIVVTNENDEQFVVVVTPDKEVTGPVDVPRSIHELSNIADFIPLSDLSPDGETAKDPSMPVPVEVLPADVAQELYRIGK